MPNPHPLRYQDDGSDGCLLAPTSIRNCQFSHWLGHLFSPLLPVISSFFLVQLVLLSFCPSLTQDLLPRSLFCSMIVSFFHSRPASNFFSSFLILYFLHLFVPSHHSTVQLLRPTHRNVRHYLLTTTTIVLPHVYGSTLVHYTPLSRIIATKKNGVRANGFEKKTTK